MADEKFSVNGVKNKMVESHSIVAAQLGVDNENLRELTAIINFI